MAALAQAILDQLRQRGLAGRGPIFSDADLAAMLQRLMDWQFGAGALEPLFREPDVEDIVINSVREPSGEVALQVWTYRQSGKRHEDIALSVEDLRQIINRNAGYQGRALNPNTPILNAQMRNGAGAGARINAVLNPVRDPVHQRDHSYY